MKKKPQHTNRNIQKKNDEDFVVFLFIIGLKNLNTCKT